MVVCHNKMAEEISSFQSGIVVDQGQGLDSSDEERAMLRKYGRQFRKELLVVVETMIVSKKVNKKGGCRVHFTPKTLNLIICKRMEIFPSKRVWFMNHADQATLRRRYPRSLIQLDEFESFFISPHDHDDVLDELNSLRKKLKKELIVHPMEILSVLCTPRTLPKSGSGLARLPMEMIQILAHFLFRK